MTTRSSQPTRPCWLEINTPAVQENYRFLRTLAGQDTECLAIVKADAYGHGLSLCAPAAVKAGAEWLGITSVEEGVAARQLCPEARIVVLGGIFPGQGAAVIAAGSPRSSGIRCQFDELEHAAASAGLPPGNVTRPPRNRHRDEPPGREPGRSSQPARALHLLRHACALRR